MLLTIGIPVYNGQKFIEQAIESIQKYNFNHNEVEIIICDNSSTDQTVNIVRNYSNLTLIQHKENVGFDGNLNRIFNYARGKYVWAIGADDLLVGNLDKLMALLRERDDFGVVFVGGSKNLVQDYQVFNVAEEFLFSTNFRSGFFPNNIIAKKIWMNCETQAFIDSGWIHYAVVLQALRIERAVLMKSKNIVENPSANQLKTWNKNGLGLLIGLKLVEIFQVMPQWGYENKFRRRTKRVIKDSYPRAIIISKMRGIKISGEILSDFIRLFGEFPTFWIIDIWILLIPSFFYMIIARSLIWVKLFK
ncbi:glycosyltransferase family 2 protein [Pedobacter sp. PWIIR3]